MKTWLIILSLIALPAAAQDMTFDPYEDTAENLAPQVETNRTVPNLKSRSGTWAYAFELLKEDGTSLILSEKNRGLLLKPASTMKIFTGWYAYKKTFRDSTYLAKMLKESVNAMADSTLAAMGGARNLRAFYGDKGLALTAANFIQADGSGLSYSNKTNCSAEIALLKLIRQDKGYEDFKTLLARPGEEGTLKERLLSMEGRLFAKTGTLKRTAALSGFVETKAGTVVFCVLSDYLPSASRNFRPKIDAMVLSNLEALGY